MRALALARVRQSWGRSRLIQTRDGAARGAQDSGRDKQQHVTSLQLSPGCFGASLILTGVIRAAGFLTRSLSTHKESPNCKLVEWLSVNRRRGVRFVGLITQK